MKHQLQLDEALGPSSEDEHDPERVRIEKERRKVRREIKSGRRTLNVR